MIIEKNKNRKAKNVFCDASGMSYGLRQSSIQVLAGVDNEIECLKTFEETIPDAKFRKHDICTLSTNALQRETRISISIDNLIFTGYSPCQYWNKVRTEKVKSEQTTYLLKHFQKVIWYFHSGFVVVEKVSGLYTCKVDLILPEFLAFLKILIYLLTDGIVNANNYGVPHNQMRYLMIATRLSTHLSLPPKENNRPVVSELMGVEKGFYNIFACYKYVSRLQHLCPSLSEKKQKCIEVTPKSGGNLSAWKDDDELQSLTYKGQDKISSDVYGLMYWYRSAPIITTQSISFPNGRYQQPDENRVISIRERATLQTFPKEYYFHGNSLHPFAYQIGKAVPPELARRVGEHIKQIHQNG